MTLEKAFFILRHGSAEGEHKYFEAISVIEKAYNRLKAENKNCGVKIQNQREQLKACNEKIKEQQAEIEKLVNIPPKDPIDFCGVVCNYAEELIEKAKSEAVKEFAEHVKQTICENCYPDFDAKGKPVNVFDSVKGYKAIDNLLKERG